MRFSLKALFKAPSAHQLAVRDLEDAKRELLSVQAAAEHQVKMVEYYSGVVTRLTQYIQSESVS